VPTNVSLLSAWPDAEKDSLSTIIFTSNCSSPVYLIYYD
jgi:hypothetical protein